MGRYFIFFTLYFFSFLSRTEAFQTIAEKKAGLVQNAPDLNREADKFLSQVNQDTRNAHAELQRLYEQIESLHKENAAPESYKTLLYRINTLKENLNNLEACWRQMASECEVEEPYALWHQPETTLQQLIIDYGSQDYVYLISQEIGAIKLNVDSNLPIPRAAWSQMLELILAQNGVGIRQLNPYLRQLYLIKENHSGIKLITSNRKELEVCASNARICFVLSPDPSDVRRVYNFMEKFINPQTVVLHLLGRDILIMATAPEVEDLLKLCDFVGNNRGQKEFRLVPVTKLKAEEMARILGAMFDQPVEISKFQGPLPPLKDLATPAQIETNGLKIIILNHQSQALFLVGTCEEIKKAMDVIQTVEQQIGEVSEKVVYWYTAKHSNPEELAQVLEKVYLLMVARGVCPPKDGSGSLMNQEAKSIQANITVPPAPFPTPEELYQDEFYQEGGFIVNPAPVQPGLSPIEVPNRNRLNFIVDLKTGAIVMVVEAHILPKLKELLKKLDVPKKMVQIEVMLFEKKINNQNDFGLNLLKVGCAASQSNETNFLWNDTCKSPEKSGVFQFLMSRVATHFIPAFDISYKFLLTQDDIQINDCPSVLAVNQTPATIAIVDEISLNTGIFDVETAKGNTLKDSFTRAQYGIIISITPTIHLADELSDSEDDMNDYITLDTDITFDHLQPTLNALRGRPDVSRRHIINQVRIPDGQTVILGGLRRKTSNDSKESIPFLGEICGFGKLFGISHMHDSSTEMFVFITAKIIRDPSDDLERLRYEQLCRRAGDIPEFLMCLSEAYRLEKCCLFQGTLTALFGRSREYYYPTNGHYVPCASPSSW